MHPQESRLRLVNKMVALTLMWEVCSLFMDVTDDCFSFFLKGTWRKKMDSDSIYDQHRMTALESDRKTRYKS